jgi:hypothetical protein
MNSPVVRVLSAYQWYRDSLPYNSQDKHYG